MEVNKLASDATTPTMIDEDFEPERGKTMRDVRAAFRKRRPGRNDTVFAVIEGHGRFQNATLFVIVLNALWLGFDVNLNHPNLADDDGNLPLMPASTAIENFFCAYFFVEVVIRFLAFERRRWCCLEGMFVFDLILALLMVLETWVTPIVREITGDSDSGGDLGLLSALRLLRLARITRMVKLMAFIPELVTLVRGMISAVKAVSWILLFLILIMYVFAIVFTSQLGDSEGPEPTPDGEDPTAEVLFSSMGSSMMTLFTNGVLGDNLAQTMDAVLQSSHILFWVFVVFFVMSALMLLNMLIGVLCQVIEDTARSEMETAKMNRLRNCLSHAFEVIDEDADGRIGRLEWKCIAQNEEVKKSLVSLGISEDTLEERLDQLADTIFPSVSAFGRTANSLDGDDEPEGLTLDAFMDKIRDLHPESEVGALDLEDFKSQITHFNRSLNKKLDRIDRILRRGVGRPSPADKAMRKAITNHNAANPLSVSYDTISPLSTATSLCSSKQFLRSVPLEVLLHILKVRC